MKRLIALMMCAVSLGAAAQLPDYVPMGGLFGWYDLDGNATDNSGNGNHGSSTDLIACMGVLQDDGGGVWFDGAGAVIEWPNAPELGLDVEDSLSFVMWVRSDFQNSPSHLLGKRGGCSGSNNINYQVAWQDDDISNDLLVGMTVTSCEESIPGYNPTSDWTHLAFTYAFGHSRMYVNGEEFLLFDCPSYPGLPNDEPLLLGRSGSCDAFEGCMDEFGIWTTELTPEQVLTIYQSSAPIEGCMDSTACNYDGFANIDNGTCASCETLATACGLGTTWDAESGTCIVANPSDSNFDGCVQLNDLLDLLSAYGDCGAEESAWQCGDPLEHQGYDYETVHIGEQCWFAENCRYLPSVGTTNYTGGTAVVYDYDGYDVDEAMSTDEYISYGVLYKHSAVESWDLCPQGWHIPSDVDWMGLETSLGMADNELDQFGFRGTGVGYELKSSTQWNGNNESGFDALAAGYQSYYLYGSVFYGSTEGLGSDAYYWTTDVGSSSGTALYRHLNSASTQIARGAGNVGFNYSVRCIKDAE